MTIGAYTTVAVISKTWMRFLLFGASLLYSGQSQRSGTIAGDVAQEVIALTERGREAALKNDMSWSEKYLSDTYAVIEANGQMRTKTDVLNAGRSGRAKFIKIDEYDREARVYGDTVIVTSKTTLDRVRDGRELRGKFAGTRVWIKQGATWKIVAAQFTPILNNTEQK